MKSYSDIPHIRYMQIITLDDMPDDTYELRFHLANEPIEKKEVHNSGTTFKFIEACFMARTVTTEFDDVYVYANTDSAIIFRDYIDSWLSERKIQLRLGSWNGN